jgi:crossover junction endodeoxyribonuclease RuvC
MIILGIDPGVSGGISIHSWGGATWSANVTAFKDVSPHDMAALIRYAKIDKAYIEQVSSMPGQGVASTFKFGENFGWWQGVLTSLGIPFIRVQPLKWQTALGCRTGGDKKVSKRKAQELFPDLRITHNTADALLIGEYGRREHLKEKQAMGI